MVLICFIDSSPDDLFEAHGLLLLEPNLLVQWSHLVVLNDPPSFLAGKLISHGYACYTAINILIFYVKNLKPSGSLGKNHAINKFIDHCKNINQFPMLIYLSFTFILHENKGSLQWLQVAGLRGTSIWVSGSVYL